MNPEHNLNNKIEYPNSLEKMILEELGVTSITQINEAMKNNIWPFKIQPKELWKKIADYFGQPISPEELVDIITGNKTEKDIKKALEKNKWPFNISEKQMRKETEDTLYKEK